MNRILTALAVSLATACPAFAQSPRPEPRFEAADIHPSSRVVGPVRFGALRDGRYDIHDATLVDLIVNAYGVEPIRVVGGPSWLEFDRFEIAARVPSSTSPADLKPMLKALLADRFKLSIREEMTTMSAMALTVAGEKPLMAESRAAGALGCSVNVQPQGGRGVPMQVMSCRGATMDTFAVQLSRGNSGYYTTPVVDATGLTGLWDGDLAWTPFPLLRAAGADAVPLPDALLKLGLKVEQRTMPTSTISVISAERAPTANPANIAELLPPTPVPEFDVAEIKPSAPGAPQGAQMLPNGQVNLRGIPMKSLLGIAYESPSEESLVVPKWAETARYDVIARVSGGGPVDPDLLRLMLRNLIIERFQIKSHTEDRPGTAYVLKASKPKLTKADPTARTKCTTKPVPPRNTTQGLNLPMQTADCQNVTMAQFTRLMAGIGMGIPRSTSVSDETGLEGSWTFTVTYTAIPPQIAAQIRQQVPPGAGGGPNAQPLASDPSGDVSFQEALDRQLGLKLETQKRAMPVVVIDTAEQPAIN